jgi:hypothetical protein
MNYYYKVNNYDNNISSIVLIDSDDGEEINYTIMWWDITKRCISYNKGELSWRDVKEIDEETYYKIRLFPLKKNTTKVDLYIYLNMEEMLI